MELELVSFKLCPFVQRSVITLNTKGVEHKTTYINLDDPPAWFIEASPFGKVPILRVSDGESEEVIFESAVINEFLDEVTGGGMMPTDPVQRALNRAWIEFASSCFMDVYDLTRAATREEAEQTVATLTGKLERMEAQFTEGPFWNGAELNLIDTAVAPLWMRLRGLESFGVYVLDAQRFPRLAAYADALLALPEVQDSVPEDFESLNETYLRQRGGFIATGEQVATLTQA